ncbi:MAG: MgtC/SapB family protein [Gemmataceae bacterium]
MDWQLELWMAGKTLLAAILGALIGLERTLQGRPAGVRTYAAVAIGACVFGMISTRGGLNLADPTRIASNVVTGMGFIGAGVIIRDRGRTLGLTTAATMWATASVGLAIAFDLLVLAIAAALIIICLLFADHLPVWRRFQREEDDESPPPSSPSQAEGR